MMVPEFLQRELQTIYGEDILRFEVFVKEICYKIFETFYCGLQERVIVRMVQRWRNWDSYDGSNVSMLIRRRGIKSQSWESLRRKMFDVKAKDDLDIWMSERYNW